MLISTLLTFVYLFNCQTYLKLAFYCRSKSKMADHFWDCHQGDRTYIWNVLIYNLLHPMQFYLFFTCPRVIMTCIHKMQIMHTQLTVLNKLHLIYCVFPAAVYAFNLSTTEASRKIAVCVNTPQCIHRKEKKYKHFNYYLLMLLVLCAPQLLNVSVCMFLSRCCIKSKID